MSTEGLRILLVGMLNFFSISHVHIHHENTNILGFFFSPFWYFFSERRRKERGGGGNASGAFIILPSTSKFMRCG